VDLISIINGVHISLNQEFASGLAETCYNGGTLVPSHDIWASMPTSMLINMDSVHIIMRESTSKRVKAVSSIRAILTNCSLQYSNEM
jgi:hypothetical protein